MTANKRLTGLDHSITPAIAVQRWLLHAHEFGSLLAYFRSLADDPEAVGPLYEISHEVRAAVQATMEKEPPAVVAEALRIAGRDAVFLVELVVELDAAADEVIATGRFRALALYSELRAIDAEARLPAEARWRTGPMLVSWDEWTEQATALAVDILRAAAARRLLERRYLGGHRALFPERCTASVGFRKSTIWLLRQADTRQDHLILDGVLPRSPAPQRASAAALAALRRTANAGAAREAAVILRKARLATAQWIGDWRTANTILDARLRESTAAL